MNKFILALPKNILKKYARNHFSEFSVDDFFQLAKKIKIYPSDIKKNKELIKNSDVLMYMLDENSDFYYFSEEAFSPECLDKIADVYANKLSMYHIEKNPILLRNEKILKELIKTYPDKIIKMIDENQMTNEIISTLENTTFVADEEDLEKFPLLLTSEKIMSKSLEKNPSFILKIDNPSENLIYKAMENGFVPTKQNLIDYPNLKNNIDVLKKVFENDPSVIVFFDDNLLTYNNIQSARSRGFIATESDLELNHLLCNFGEIMNDAIRNNPKLIRLIGDKCYLDRDTYKKALSEYKITKKDIENNPNLAKSYELMTELPEFSLYSAFLDDKAKLEETIKALKKSKNISTDELPFFDTRFGGKTDVSKINKLLSYLDLKIDENDINIQDNYAQMLDKVADGIVEIDYETNKVSFKYPDIVSINDDVINLCKEVYKTKNYELLSKFANELYEYVGKTIDIEILKADLNELYNTYANKNSLSREDTTKFCNKILNLYRDYYMNTKKEELLSNAENDLKLSDKKKKTILNGRKLKKIEKIISNADFQQLGITEEEYDKEINNVINTILNNKDVLKSDIDISIDKLKKIGDCSKAENLNEKYVCFILKTDNIEVAKYITKKFNNIKFKYLNKVELAENESHISYSDKIKLGGINQTNYIIGDNDRCTENIAKLLLELDDETIDEILENKDLIKEVIFLLPYVNLIKGLDTKTFINILVNYDRIKDKISMAFDSKDTVDFAVINLMRVKDLISLANAYSSVDDITLLALGNNVVSTVGEINSSKYLDFYKDMLKRQKGSIPPISMQSNNPKAMYFESGKYSDQERLLIGKKVNSNSSSCIDLFNSAGRNTYNYVLLEDNGDVILIRDENRQLVSRIFVFRCGTVVQLVTSVGENVSIEVLKQISDSIIKQAINKNDNIDYVFINSSSYSLPNDEYPTIKDDRFETKIPHVDKSSSAILLSSKKKMLGYKEDELELDFEAEQLASYDKKRKEIDEQPLESDITRLRALRIALEENSEKKEEMARNFEPFYDEEYSKVICGEDWYIAIKKDGTVEELLLPLNDSRAKKEMEDIKEKFNLNESKKEIAEMMNDIHDSELVEDNTKGITY